VKEEKKINMILGSHAHVPSGAREADFEFAYLNKIKPFVSNLYRYSNIHAVLHYSGVLLYWIERNHSEFLMLIEDMVSRKQVELLGGGFYEPSFPLIPLADRIGQIELLTTYLRKHFGKRPLGCWMPDFVWEQNLAAAISSGDMNYTFLSGDQFLRAGMNGADLFSPCITEDQGKLVTVFPVSLPIEKDLEQKSFSQVFVELKNKFETECPASNEVKIISVFPQKVASSQEEAPDTAWNRFFEEISLSENIVETILPSKILKTQKKYKKTNFKDSCGLIENFSPRNFLIEHAEANGIYSKMIFTNVLINQLKGDKARKLNAREELWKAQDSCLFSEAGKFQSSLRKSAYSSLLRAERLTRDNGKFVSSLVQHDFDFDGIKEHLFQDVKINCYIQLRGAGIFELDYLPKEWNYLDCGCDENGRKTAFADIIAPQDLEIDDSGFLDGKNSRLCHNEQYEALSQDRKGKSCFKLSNAAENIPFNCMEIQKCFLLKKEAICVSYQLKNTGTECQKFRFVTKIDFSFAGIGDEYVRFYTIDKTGKDIHLESKFDTDNLKIHDLKNEVQIVLSSKNGFSGCLVPCCKNGIYQATGIFPGFQISLEPNESWTNEFTLKFSH